VTDFNPVPHTDTPNVADFDSHGDDIQDHILNNFVEMTNDNNDVGDFGEPHVPLRRSFRHCLPYTHYSCMNMCFSLM